MYRRGEGPGVLLMHEIPGITPEVQACARRIADAGFTVYMPWMFGTPNKAVSAPYAMGQMFRAICIRKEFTTLARGESSPITNWLRALARKIHAMGIKMVLSGEGADEIFGGYLYFHKAPNARAFH